MVGDEPFAILLADDLLDAEVPVMKQMVDLHAHYGSSIVGVEEIQPEQSRSYGVVEGTSFASSLLKLNGIVEKPKPEDAPSNLGVVGRYVMNPSIFQHLREMPPGSGGELQLTDGIARLLKQEAVMSYCFDGKRYDCGSKQGYLQATVEFALRHPEVQDEFRAWLKALDLQQRGKDAEVALPPMKPAANGPSVLYM